MKININLKQNPYFVYIDEDIDSNFLAKFSKVVVLTNTTLYSLYKDKLKDIIQTKFELIIINDGEDYKNYESVNYILDELFKLKADRKSLLIGFGGGVITDMTGFAASIYQRGIKSLYIPTTLLACVDAAVGGKTGINNKYGKNLIGTFYQPSGVYVFTNFFDTLGKKELSAAMSEVVKMAVLFDKEFFEFLESIDKEKFLKLDKEVIKHIILRSVELKRDVVISDEKEANLRKVLNYGHTFAHVLEKQGDYKLYLHGEAVAIGLSMINKLAVRLNLMPKELATRIDNLLLNFNLFIDTKIDDENAFYDDLFLDKKSEFSQICFIIARDFGKFEFFYDIKKEDVLKLLSEYK